MPGAQHGAGGIRTQARAAVTAPGRGAATAAACPGFGTVWRACVRSDRPSRPAIREEEEEVEQESLGPARAQWRIWPRPGLLTAGRRDLEEAGPGEARAPVHEATE